MPGCRLIATLNGSFPICRMTATGVRRDKVVVFQRVKGPFDEVLQPEATGAAAEVTKPLKLLV